jgi:hypothetical protein
MPRIPRPLALGLTAAWLAVGAGSSGHALAADPPRVIYLWYADGGPLPAPGPPCEGKVPPAYTCDFGRDLEDCKRQVQAYLDRWYADFNAVFTLEQPQTTPYYTVVITSSGSWCEQGSMVGGVAPINCRNIESGVSYAFLCGRNPKACASIIAQEQAHTVGLAHTTSRTDVMYPALQAIALGFENAENLVSGGLCRRTQNSYAMMLDRLGPWPGGPKPSPFPGAEIPAETKPPPPVTRDPAGGETAGNDLDPFGLVGEEKVVHGGCAVGGNRAGPGGPLGIVLAALIALLRCQGIRRRRRLDRHHRVPPPGCGRKNARAIVSACLGIVGLGVAAPAPPLALASASGIAEDSALGPRLVTLGASATAVGRYFRYDAPLQRESTFARPGVAGSLEVFPFRALGGAAGAFGLELAGAKETGHASLQQAAFASLRLPVTEDRAHAALKLALAPGGRVLLLPTLGLGQTRFQIEEATMTLPSHCRKTSEDICLPRVRLQHLFAGLGSRVALWPNAALTAGAAFHFGLDVHDHFGYLAAEARARALGVAGELGLRIAFTRNLGALLSFALTHFRYGFRGGGVPYSSASETYPMGAAGLWVATSP